MPLGGMIPYEGEDMELPVSLSEGDTNDGQYMGPEGDRTLPAEEDDVLQRLLRKRVPRTSGLPQLQHQMPGMPGMPSPGMDEDVMAAARALAGGRG